MNPKKHLASFTTLLSALIVFLSYSACDFFGADSDIDANLRRMASIDNPPVGNVIEEVIPAYDPRNVEIPGYDPSYPTDVQKVTSAVGFDTGVCLDPTSDIIWPGSLLDGGSIRDGRYTPITVKRGPLTFSTSNYNQSVVAATVPEAKTSTVRQGVSDILSSMLKGTCPSRTNFTIEDVYSAEQFGLAIGASFKGFGANVSTGFNFNQTEKNTRQLVRFVQNFFSLDIDMPYKPTDFFDPDITWEELSAAFESTTAPVYVSSIKYGRMAYYCVESSASSTDLDIALNAAYKGYGATAKVSTGVTAETVLRNSTINAFIIGGDGIEASSAITYDQFLEWVQGNGNFSANSPVAPLSYTLRYLKDNSVADVVLASTYYVRKTAPLVDPTPDPNPEPTPAPGSTYDLQVNISKIVVTCSKPLPSNAAFPIEVFAYNGSTTILHDIVVVPFDSVCPSGTSPITWNVNCSKIIQIPKDQVTSDTTMEILALQHNTGFGGTGTIGGQNIPVVAAPGVNSSFNCTPVGAPYTVKVYYNIVKL